LKSVRTSIVASYFLAHGVEIYVKKIKDRKGKCWCGRE